jgi:hypothetical protein
MPKRFQTYFGVPIPPQKREKIGAGSTTIRFVITGKIPSKKNNQQAVTVRQPTRKWAIAQQKKGVPASWELVHKAINMTSSKMRGNAAYNDFIKLVKPVIQSQMQEWSKRLGEKGLTFPLPKSSMCLRLYFKDRYIRDTVNAQQTIQDALVVCGVISDDNYNTLNPIFSESECYYEEIIYNIAFISLSFKL